MVVIKTLKQLVSVVPEVVCPYCNELDGKGKHLLHFSHLKKHGKKLVDVRVEFPDHVTMTLDYYQRSSDFNKNAAQASAATAHQIKTINCVHCRKEMSVKNYESNTQACPECLSNGLDNPDGRTKEHANEAREKTLKGKHGPNVTNAAHVPGVTEKKIATNIERYGGVGFGADYGRDCRFTMEETYGDENIMKTEEGVRRFVKGIKKKYGVNITNPLQIPEIKRKVSESLRRKYEQEDHHLKGKTYEEIYGEEKARELKEQRRISGAKGYRMSVQTSAPQKELFDLVQEIFPSAKLEHETFSYFLDIAILEHKLCIEYDGSFWHDTEEQKEKDQMRERILNELGWKIIRFVDYVPTKEELVQKIKEVLS